MLSVFIDTLYWTNSGENRKNNNPNEKDSLGFKTSSITIYHDDKSKFIPWKDITINNKRYKCATLVSDIEC